MEEIYLSGVFYSLYECNIEIKRKKKKLSILMPRVVTRPEMLVVFPSCVGYKIISLLIALMIYLFRKQQFFENIEKIF
jgi:hypothetical protein